MAAPRTGPTTPKETDMNTYREAHRWALQMKASGATPAELQDRARRFDDDGKYGAAKAFRDVAGE